MNPFVGLWIPNPPGPQIHLSSLNACVLFGAASQLTGIKMHMEVDRSLLTSQHRRPMGVFIAAHAMKQHKARKSIPRG